MLVCFFVLCTGACMSHLFLTLSTPSGLELSFWIGAYPRIVGNKDPDISLPPRDFNYRSISYLLITIGIAEILGVRRSSFSSFLFLSPFV